ncbi:MAG: Hsp20/alpha crystallin family protein [Planctomycetes bacterium]|nr:Hsp20/alpha crystallin family protein [Planctomycetota bacterium]
MSKRGKGKEGVASGVFGLGGLLGGLGTMLEKLGELAEKGKDLRESGEITSADGKVRGVYGFNIRMGLGDEKDAVSVEPFGNVRKDERTGKAVVQEVREPLVDTFEEEGHVLVVAEMPGIAEEDVRVELRDDILTITAEKGDKKYRKEVLLPAAFGPDKMSHSCRNGVLEVKFQR